MNLFSRIFQAPSQSLTKTADSLEIRSHCEDRVRFNGVLAFVLAISLLSYEIPSVWQLFSGLLRLSEFFSKLQLPQNLILVWLIIWLAAVAFFPFFLLYASLTMLLGQERIRLDAAGLRWEYRTLWRTKFREIPLSEILRFESDFTEERYVVKGIRYSIRTYGLNVWTVGRPLKVLRETGAALKKPDPKFARQAEKAANDLLFQLQEIETPARQMSGTHRLEALASAPFSRPAGGTWQALKPNAWVGRFQFSWSVWGKHVLTFVLEFFLLVPLFFIGWFSQAARFDVSLLLFTGLTGFFLYANFKGRRTLALPLLRRRLKFQAGRLICSETLAGIQTQRQEPDLTQTRFVRIFRTPVTSPATERLEFSEWSLTFLDGNRQELPNAQINALTLSEACWLGKELAARLTLTE